MTSTTNAAIKPAMMTHVEVRKMLRAAALQLTCRVMAEILKERAESNKLAM